MIFTYTFYPTHIQLTLPVVCRWYRTSRRRRGVGAQHTMTRVMKRTPHHHHIMYVHTCMFVCMYVCMYVSHDLVSKGWGLGRWGWSLHYHVLHTGLHHVVLIPLPLPFLSLSFHSNFCWLLAPMLNFVRLMRSLTTCYARTNSKPCR